MATLWQETVRMTLLFCFFMFVVFPNLKPNFYIMTIPQRLYGFFRSQAALTENLIDIAACEGQKKFLLQKKKKTEKLPFLWEFLWKYIHFLKLFCEIFLMNCRKITILVYIRNWTKLPEDKNLQFYSKKT